jgi:hydroxymethylglutaryl-CoA lyase
MSSIMIRDVCPRDGLQGERLVPPQQRAGLAGRLAAAGVGHVEAASFVSPKAVPAMAAAEAVVAALPDHRTVTWWALAPNAMGATAALAAGIVAITLTISASEQYSIKNVGRSSEQARLGLADIGAAVGTSAQLDVVISCAFGSPFHDVVDPSPTTAIVEAALDALPGAWITLADTTGTATPRRIRQVLAGLPAAARRHLGLHLHDTRGTALANALAAIELDVQRFDTAVGGLGGSPFAPGAGGNLATEDLVLMLHDLGADTGIDLDALLVISRSLADLIGHPVPSRVSEAGPLPAFQA